MSRAETYEPPRIRNASGESLHCRLGLFLCLVSWFVAISARSADTTYTESEVKAMCVVNFAKYTEWPTATFPASNSPISIGLIGQDPVGNSLSNVVAGKTISGRPIVLRPLKSEAECVDCQIVFVSSSEAKRLPEVLDAIKNKPVLTIGETDSFLDDGGIINFAKRKGKVRFDVNLEAARRAGLQISSKVLALADEVRGNK